MKSTYITLMAMALMVSFACNNNSAPANSVKTDSSATTKEEAAAPPDSATMMKAWMDYMTPSEMHKLMASCDGEWISEITMWMSPDAPPSQSTSTCSNKMILGGRYQQSEHKGSFDGMPFEGMSTTGFDNSKKKFVSTWIDNMGSGMMIMEGTYDVATKTMNCIGKQVDPVSGKDMDMRQTLTFVDNDHQTMEMYTTPAGGKEYKNMEIKYTRKVKAK